MQIVDRLTIIEMSTMVWIASCSTVSCFFFVEHSHYYPIRFYISASANPYRSPAVNNLFLIQRQKQ